MDEVAKTAGNDLLYLKEARSKRVDKARLTELVNQHKRVTSLSELIQERNDYVQRGLDHLLDDQGYITNGRLINKILEDLVKANVIDFVSGRTPRGHGSKYFWKKGPFEHERFTHASAAKASSRSSVIRAYSSEIGNGEDL